MPTAAVEKTNVRRAGGLAGIAKHTLPCDRLTDAPVIALAKFSRLVSTLGHATGRESQLRILRGLAGISKQYYGHPKKSHGSTALADALEPISRFIRKYIRDEEVVGAAVEVLTRTGPMSSFMKELDSLADAARAKGAFGSLQKILLAQNEYDF